MPYETGVARYREIARGHILGDNEGILKLIFHQSTHEILGVWCMGTQATELVHIGQAVMSLNGTLEYFVRNVFNYPTLAECYKVAALNGMNKLRALHAELDTDDDARRELDERGASSFELLQRRLHLSDAAALARVIAPHAVMELPESATTIGTLAACAWFSASIVCGFTPSSAATTRTAMSVT